jgi:hypothetical protein
VLPLDGPPLADGYRAAIESADGREEWASAGSLLADAATGQLDVDVPAALLPEGDYELVLRAATGRRHELAAYAFTVLRSPAR